MDTVQEETSPPPSPLEDTDCQSFVLPPVPQIVVGNDERSRRNSHRRPSELDSSRPNSRRPSTIIAALRRPSQAWALSAAHAVMNQRRYIMGLLNDHGDETSSIEEPAGSECFKSNRVNQKLGNEALSKILSTLYGKLLVVLGIAFPVTEIISAEVQPFFYQGFYLYLYIGSISFVVHLYAAPIRERISLEIRNFYNRSRVEPIKKSSKPAQKFGSFYLRAGAIAFGIGSMVYSGLEFGRYFELRNNPDCYSNIIQAITPATRMFLTLVQVQFLFLNNKDFEFNKHKTLARFGLMHMVASNLCEWLYVLVEETKHEIIHLEEHSHNTSRLALREQYCKGNIMGSLVSNSSPFLFPCTIEYSLICAVILFEMWKQVEIGPDAKTEKEKKNSRTPASPNRVTNQFLFNLFGDRLLSANHHYTIDCSNAHKGLFAGIMLTVLTIISLIMFFVLTRSDSSVPFAILEVNVVELILYIATTVAVLVAMLKMRKLKYVRKFGREGKKTGIGLDCTLLVVSQTGMFIYCMFSIIGCYFTRSSINDLEMVTEIFSFIQTCIQTIFVLDGWWRKCSNIQQTKRKPARQLITFLIIANMAMWTMNTLEKNRAEFRPSHLKFFGEWAWTIITHISMPLAIFYRFHSTICLFEMWKNAYKIKARLQTQCFPLV